MPAQAMLVVLLTLALLGLAWPGADVATAQSSAPDATAEHSAFAGRWRGVLNEDGKRTVIELALSQDAGGLSGQFAAYPPGADEPSLERPLAGVTHSDDGLTFAVPLTGQIDERTIFMRLRQSGRVLVGTGRQNRNGAPERELIMVRIPSAS